ncbi:AmmeMemoRadiSam system radical SAM enzyme [Candidatus Marsarchaeota G2 archaeon ECH_B_SAG-F08]|jgi:Pyruvate-formate lyase-activating enzyme|uniref:AmmeMemoRadiSam system radical SAM enzyme n=7 Tax=Candidatus Marsarchaeota TaxID=1978152 RepID=A0A2R6BYP9_9ARCH|nr:MAG: AmmeMemoRadiSam system radical SAM enzyme [Candidatus Marsarchaeota G1 archaeon OSP_D]PSN85913.1 MAG: AmmeMemoRadiSam system radical SAM enzyme [Candidatus Marsarchaeota G1 archaeon BE_D]PSN88608.1 MAG: AmmeMemoRadiSam system radical SAM enzyme [Candidatus Marsarchaeota G1 archaeon OSP_C]PSN99288.1 MAG: AmmeMemoRadiSam system radical SAM enzyme [Candidatus Marsarchaeota G2 archaeon ECH_B_SAG-F08]PSO02913.1 MAG: AmmeMemoRadiSam system radical SAM enzyme [Candidatus Marsarchaeota G2 archa
MMKEATLYKVLPNGRVMCTACARYCQIGENQVGLCGIRQNIGGKLYLMVYGRVIAGHIDPIEKKPVMHYRPGSKIFSIATTGCNWLCRYCQNYDISQRRKVEGEEYSPKEIARMAYEAGCQGIAYTYNEPTIFIEFARDVGVEAHKLGLFNIFVSNGFGTREAVGVMNEFLDCITVDFKGNAEPNFLRRYVGIPGPEPIFEELLEIKRKTKIHIEITDLVVPKVGDSLEHAEKLSKWVYDNLGADTPIHFLRFHPDYKMMDFPWTPVETLERHYEVAKKVGLKYVYIGNVPGHPYENTYCPSCGELLIERYGFEIVSWNLDKGNTCPKCGEKIPIYGTLEPTYRELRFLPVI